MVRRAIAIAHGHAGVFPAGDRQEAATARGQRRPLPHESPIAASIAPSIGRAWAPRWNPGRPAGERASRKMYHFRRGLEAKHNAHVCRPYHGRVERGARASVATFRRPRMAQSISCLNIMIDSANNMARARAPTFWRRSGGSVTSPLGQPGSKCATIGSERDAGMRGMPGMPGTRAGGKSFEPLRRLADLAPPPPVLLPDGALPAANRRRISPTVTGSASHIWSRFSRNLRSTRPTCALARPAEGRSDF